MNPRASSSAGEAPSLGYRPALDGIRGIAIAAVVLNHQFDWPSGGFLGVDLFFVLSGFLITTLLLEQDARGGISLRGFYVRRARRLLPAVAALVSTFLALAITFAPSRAGHWVAVTAESCLYVANLIRAFVPSDPLQSEPFGHLWSLAAEEQFYLVWPLVLLWLLRRNLRAVTLMLAGILAVAVVYRVALVAEGGSWTRIYFSPDTHSTGLILGCLVALIRRQGYRMPGWAGPAGLLATLGFLAVAESHSTAWLAYGLFPAEIAFAVLVVAMTDRPMRLLTAPPLVWLGLISYSLYLWHQPIRWWAEWGSPVTTTVASLLAASACYYAIERPFRRRAKPKPVAAPTGAAVTAGATSPAA